MSLILDALRRRTPGEPSDDSSSSARADSVLAMLGYPHQQGAGPSLQRLVWYGIGAIAVGFIAVAGLVLVLTPSASSRVTANTPVVRAQPVQPAKSAPVIPGRSSAPVVPTGRDLAPAQAAVRPAEPPPATAPVRPPAPPSPPPRETPPPVATAPPTTIPPPARRAPRAPSVPQPAPEPAPATTVRSERATPAPSIDHFALALYYQRLGDFDMAMSHYRSLLETNAASAEVHNNLGLLYQDRGQNDEAIGEFQQAIALDPKYVRGHNNLGVALMRAGRLDAAAGELRVALADDPRNVESVVNLALVQKAAGRSADARDLLQHAVNLDPRNAGAHYNLAVVADEVGDRAVAVAHYRAFLQYGAVEHGDLVPRVRARLATLGG